jgi:hypothetical protein
MSSVGFQIICGGDVAADVSLSARNFDQLKDRAVIVAAGELGVRSRGAHAPQLTEVVSRGEPFTPRGKMAGSELYLADFVNDRDNLGNVRNVMGIGRTHSGPDRFAFQKESVSTANDRVHLELVRSTL